MLRKAPGIFVAGEMIDWEAPTGGYLLQGCFATGTRAGRSAAERVSLRNSGMQEEIREINRITGTTCSAWKYWPTVWLREPFLFVSAPRWFCSVSALPVFALTSDFDRPYGAT